MADQDTKFKLIVEDAGTPTLKAFGSEASKVLGIEREVAAAGGEIGTALEAAGGKARDASGRFLKAGQDGKTIGKGVGEGAAEAATGVDKLGSRTDAAMALYKRAVGGGTVSLKEMKAAADALNREMDEAATPEDRARFAALAREVEQTEQATRRAATAFSAAEKEVHGLGRGAQAGQMALGQFGQTGQMALGVLGGNALGVAAEGLALGVAHVVRSNMELSTTVSDLSAITGIAGDDLNRLRDAGIDLSISSGRSAADSIDAYKLLASNIDIASIGGVEGLKTLGQQVVTLSLAARVDLATAADATASTLNQFGLSATESSRVVNLLAAGAKAGAAEVDDLAESLRTSGAAAFGANLSVEETVGALEVLAQNAQKGSEAGTGLQTMITILQTQTEKLAKAGIRGVNIETDGLAATLVKLKPLLSDAAAMSEVFGMEGLKTARILITNAEAVDEMTTAVTGTNTAAEQAAVQMDNLAGDVDKMTAAANALALEGGVVNDELREMVQWTTEVLVGIRALTDGTQDLGGMLSGLGSALGTLQDIANRLNVLKYLMDSIRGAGVQQNIDDMREAATDLIRPAAFRGGSAPVQTTSGGGSSSGSAGAGSPTETPKQRAARLRREQGERDRAAERQRRDDEQARADSVRLEAEASDARRKLADADAAHTADIREQERRAEARDAAERIRLDGDVFAQRRATLDAERTQRATAHTDRLTEIERVAMAEIAATNTAFDREETRIADAKKKRGLSADEQERLNDELAAAAAARDLALGETNNRRVLAQQTAIQDNLDAETEASAARRQLESDEYEQAKRLQADLEAKDHRRWLEVHERAQRDMDRARAAAAEEERIKREAHERQMERLQEQADAVLAAVGLASTVTAAASSRRRAEADAEYADATHYRDRAQDDDLERLRARVDAERGVVDERTDLEKQLDATKSRIEASRAAADLAYRRKAAEMDRTAAIAERRTRLFEIAIATALNVVKAFPNPVKMALAGALGVTQGAAVAGQPLPAIPQYALGTDRARGGLALVGERGPELVNLPGGSSVITNDRTERLGAAMRAVESVIGGARSGGMSSQVVVQQVSDPAHAAALDTLRRETAGQTARLERGLADVARAVEKNATRIDGLDLFRGLQKIGEREEAAGNTRTR